MVTLDVMVAPVTTKFTSIAEGQYYIYIYQGVASIFKVVSVSYRQAIAKSLDYGGGMTILITPAIIQDLKLRQVAINSIIEQ